MKATSKFHFIFLESLNKKQNINYNSYFSWNLSDLLVEKYALLISFTLLNILNIYWNILDSKMLQKWRMEKDRLKVSIFINFFKVSVILVELFFKQ